MLSNPRSARLAGAILLATTCLALPSSGTAESVLEANSPYFAKLRTLDDPDQIGQRRFVLFDIMSVSAEVVDAPWQVEELERDGFVLDEVMRGAKSVRCGQYQLQLGLDQVRLIRHQTPTEGMLYVNLTVDAHCTVLRAVGITGVGTSL
jgi:hypothetical protein